VSEIVRRAFAVECKSQGDGSRAVDVIASTEALDLDGEVVVQDWNLGRYISNPVVLYNHNFVTSEPGDTLPIGFATSVGVVDGKLQATLNFVDEKASELAERCYQGFRQGSLRAVSVGFRSKLGRMETRDGRDVYVLSGNELLEISVCPVGMNPDAVAAEKAKSLAALTALVKTNEPPAPPVLEERTEMKTVAKALGLNEDASEAEVLSAVTTSREGAKAIEQGKASFERRVLEATGAKGLDEAFGVIRAGLSAVEQLGATTKSLNDARAEIEKRDREGLISKGLADRKLTPATREWAETAPIDSLKAFLEKAPAIPALSGTGAREPTNAPTREPVPDIAGKSWENLTPAQKHDLFVEDRAAYDALKADHQRRGSPKPRAAA
jgi:HK97 family phage prohead protease